MTDDALLALGRALLGHGYRFTTVTPATHARVNARPGNDRGSSLAAVFGWSRPAPAGGLPADVFDAGRAAGVLVPHGNGWRSTLRASTLHEHLFFHSAYPTTQADAVFFGPDTYRFAAAIDAYLAGGHKVGRAVDIGCGAGPGAVVVALARLGADVYAVDINDEAVRLTAVNVLLAGATAVKPRRSDLLSALEGDFDLIVANPPYLLDPDERVYRHGGGGLGEGLSLAIAAEASGRLAPGGTLLLYTGSAIVDGGDRFRAMVLPKLSACGLEANYVELDPDVFGEELLEPAYAEADRIAAVLVIGKRP
ncbi:MAG: class I SAM-dependent methyltransferase [Caldimonas sp.]